MTAPAITPKPPYYAVIFISVRHDRDNGYGEAAKQMLEIASKQPGFLNGGPAFKHNEAFSFQVATEDQAETDRYWNTIVGNGGQESECGWCKDKWGVSWQITPIALIKAYTNPDLSAAKRAFDAMMTMKKIDVAVIDAAVRG